MKRAVKYVLIIIGCFLAAVLFIISLFAVPFAIVGITGHIQDQKIKNDTFRYVLENKDTIQLNPSVNHQEFIFTTTGSWDTYVEYGYYYSADDTYDIKPTEESKYKRGYRYDGIHSDPLERHCANPPAKIRISLRMLSGTANSIVGIQGRHQNFYYRIKHRPAVCLNEIMERMAVSQVSVGFGIDPLQLIDQTLRTEFFPRALYQPLLGFGRFCHGVFDNTSASVIKLHTEKLPLPVIRIG